MENFLYFEDNGIEYVVKCKMYSTVKMIIDFINNPRIIYGMISSNLSVTEITVPLPKWQRARFVIIREKIIPKMNQLMFEECKYKYQAIVTNIDYLTPEEIFQDYNQRCDVENNIDEIKKKAMPLAKIV